MAAVVAGTLLLATPALALSKHTFDTSFAGSGTNALAATANGPSDLAVDQSTGDVYVTDPADHRVEKFTASGEFLLMFGQEVNKGLAEAIKAKEAHGGSPTPAELQAENVCSTQPGEECQPGISTYHPRYLAVDNSGGPSAGDLYVAFQGDLQFENEEFYVVKFDPNGHPVTAWRNAGKVSPAEFNHVFFPTSGLTVDPGGDLFFANLEFGQFGSFAANPPLRPSAFRRNGNFFAPAGSTVHEFNPAGADLGLLTGPGFTGPATGLASNISTGQLYVADAGASIRHYGPACQPSFAPCAPTDSFGGPQLGNATAIALDESSEVLYAADTANHRVDVFTPEPFLPDVTTATATEPTATSATLNGKVDPSEAGEVTACHFSYVTDAAFKADQVNEVQALTLSAATGGTLALAFEGQATAATGTGNLTSDRNVTGLTTATGTFAVGEVISGEGIPPGTTIIAIEPGIGSLVLSAATTQTKADVALTAPGLPYNAPAATVQSALEALSTIGSANVEVAGPEGGPYTVEFKRELARNDVPLLSADSSALTPQPTATASVETTTQGGGGWGTATSVPCLNQAGEEVDTHPILNSTTSASVHAAISPLTPETTYHFRLAATDANGTAQSAGATFTPHTVIGLTTEAPTHLTGTSATLQASLLGDATPTSYHFQWGTTESYGHETEPQSAGEPHGPATTGLQAQIEGLAPLATYHYRVLAENGSGEVSLGEDQSFTEPPGAPRVTAESVALVHTESAQVLAQIDPESGDTVYHVESGTAPCSAHPDPCSATPALAGKAGIGSTYVEASTDLLGLSAGTTYHYRVVAENVSGTTDGPERTFTTLPFARESSEPCPNSHVRQQTSSSALLDCRAYELVSAANSGGYDVESNLVEGQAPYGSYPEAEGRVLYGVHGGGIPGTGDTTNRGVDPYVATRGNEGWSTEYVGIPANLNAKSAPFSSTLAEADPALDAFAFAGPALCAPCFTEKGAIETGIPLRLPSGSLLQGMAGSAKAPSTAKPDGYIARYFSANGEHFVFGSTSRFAAGGNEETGDVSIYDRNLTTGQTHVVSVTHETEDFPESLPCIQGVGKCDSTGKDSNGIAELAISSDGSRILVAQKVSEDADHNASWHLYMDVGDATRSIDLTPGVIAKHGGPGFSEGVLFDGMTEDGSKVFFTTKDKLLPTEDTDESPDIYEAELGPQGTAATLHLVSVGSAGPSNSDACHPVANSGGPHWNAVGSAENCGAVPIGGGGGIASAGGSIYFLSPENLTAGASCGIPCSGEEPVQNQPNLYLAAPGSAPRFIATLEPENPLVLDAVSEAATRHTADFQVTPSGDFAAFPSTLPLAGSGEETAGHTEVYRYDAPSGNLDCASCTLTGEPSSSDSSLASNGLSLTDDGRLFFTTADQLLATDTDAKLDVYEWAQPGAGNCAPTSPAYSSITGACRALVSAGTGAFDSGLLGVSASGKDAYFFTHDSLAPQDKNGPTMKIYDAREGGGFPYLFPQATCRASDECHGAASPAPGPLEIGSESGTPNNSPSEEPKPCKRGYVKKHGHCVQRHPHKHRHHKRANHHRGGKK